MTRVKICGITRAEDAQAAAALGADALGFILYAGSKRAIAPEAAAAIIRDLPPFVARVGVFVNEDPARMRELRDALGLSAIQLSGDEPATILAALDGPVIKAFRSIPADLSAWRVAAWLADGAASGSYGGTGTAADAGLVRTLALCGRLILAGGLVAETVGALVRAHRPYAVDVASGVESAPGVKDRAKMAAFIRATKSADDIERAT